MDIYAWMRLVSQHLPVSEPVKADALALADDLERVNVFGTTAAQTDSQTHTCTYGYPPSDVCSICQKARQ